MWVTIEIRMGGIDPQVASRRGSIPPFPPNQTRTNSCWRPESELTPILSFDGRPNTMLQESQNRRPRCPLYGLWLMCPGKKPPAHQKSRQTPFLVPPDHRLSQYPRGSPKTTICPLQITKITGKLEYAYKHFIWVNHGCPSTSPTQGSLYFLLDTNPFRENSQCKMAQQAMFQRRKLGSFCEASPFWKVSQGNQKEGILGGSFRRSLRSRGSEAMLPS